jgi:outer membrane protein TolC
MVFTGGKLLAANRAADARVVENQEQLLYTESILVTELAKRYYGYTLSMEAATVYQQVMDGIEQHLNRAKKLEMNGMLATSERLHAEVAYADAVRTYKKAIRKTDLVQAGLKNTLSSEETITPVSPLFLTKKIQVLEKYLESARQKNHVLKKIAATKEIATQGYKAELSSHLPKIYFFGKYELYKEDLTILEPEWAAGVGIRFSLFEGLSHTHKIMAAKKQKEAVRYYEAKAMRNIQTLVEKKYSELMTAIEQFDALEASMRFAMENMRVQKRAFKAGMTTSLNVVDAQLALSKVKIEKLNAVYAFDVALAQLLEVCGLSQTYGVYQNNDDVEVQF